jgi:tRNA nucleotidyltransferase (CCA-adding enzyme)
VFTHTQHCLDALAHLEEWQASAAARRRLIMFTVLAHDFGKPSTTIRAEKRGAVRWLSPGHEPAGGPLAMAFLRRIGAPLELDIRVCALVVHHLVHHHGSEGSYTDSQVRRLARKLVPATIDDLAQVMTADSLGRPPLSSPETLRLIAELRAKAHALEVESGGPRPLVQGRHLVALGRTPGPSFKPILDAAFEAQLDGAFSDESGGREWLKRHLQETGAALG